MPLTAIDPTPALVVIDLQRGVAAMPTAPYPAAAVIERAAVLAKTFRRRGFPVVLVNVDDRAPGRTDAPPPNLSAFPPGWTELVPELEPQPTDLRITKKRWGAFHGTRLDDELKKRGVTQIMLAGVATSAGVESTARFAAEYGYNVVFVVDAMSDRDAESHRNSIERIFPRIGETATTDDVLGKIEMAPARVI